MSITRELLRLPAGLFMRTAEALGAWVLAAWLRAWPVLVAAWILARRGLALAQERLTPARMTLAVGAVTVVALAASQFVDYRAISIGTASYAGVEGVAPPPQVDAQSTGSAHLWLGLPLAALAALILASCAAGRWRSARLLVPVGLAVVAISLFVDRPKGLDEGDAAVVYDGASAMLLGGFWAQLASGVVLVALAPLLSRVLRPEAAAGGTKPTSTRQRPRTSPLARLRRPKLRNRRPAAGGAAR